MKQKKGLLPLVLDDLSRKMEQIDFELLSFGYWQQQDISVQEKDILSHYKLVCITQGTCTVTISKHEYFLRAGDSILIPPYVVYWARCTSEAPVELYVFRFQINGLSGQTAFQELFPREFIMVFQESLSPSAAAMLNLSYENMILQKQGNYYLTKLAFLRTMIHLLRATPHHENLSPHSHHTRGKEQTVSSCVKYMKAHLSSSVTVEDLCQALHVSQSYLYQCFITVTGLSTKEYIITYKLRFIERELAYSNRSIQELADAFGFSSIYSFSSQFKQYYHMSPLQFRKKQRP